MKQILALAATLVGLNMSWADDNVCRSSNGFIETSVNAEAKTSFLHTVEHKWKFDFWNGAVCWGSPDDQYQDDQNLSGSSKQCNGSMKFTTNRNNQLNYSPMSLSWGANLNEGDTFSIHLTDERTQAVYDESNSDCTSHRRGAKLEYASMVFDTRAVLNVPEDVWVVQVRSVNKSPGLMNSPAALNPQIGRQSLRDPKNPTAHLISLANKEWTYLYVEPGEALEVVLKYQSQALNSKTNIDVDYQFKFIGHNRCTEALGDPKQISYSPQYLNKMIDSAPTSAEQYHQYAVKLGCMRNPVFLKAAMNNSRPDDLLPMLKDLETHTEDVIKAGVSSQDTSTGESAPYMFSILNMTLVDISRFAITDLLTYCKTYRNFTRETLAKNGVSEVAGIEFMMTTYSQLETIYSQLARNSLDTLVSRISQWNKDNITYAQVFDGNADAQIALKAYQHQMIQSGLEIYGRLYTVISKQVPAVQIQETYRQNLLAELTHADELANQLNVSIVQMLRNFGRRSNKIIQVDQVETNVKQLADLDKQIHDDMREYFKWFIAGADQSGAGDRFVEALVTMRSDVLAPAANVLAKMAKEQNLTNFDAKFLRSADLNALNDQATQCIFHPYGVQK